MGYLAGHSRPGACALGLAVWAALAPLAGCGPSVVEIEVKNTADALEQARRGGQAWGCHEQPSEVFGVYLVCPARETTFAVVEQSGKIAFVCPDRAPTKCERLGRQLLRHGGAPDPKAPASP